MVLSALVEAYKHGELILIDGGFCRWHLFKNGQITIYEIFSMRQGAGSEILEILKKKQADSIFAKCPVSYPSNEWYHRKGFQLEEVQNDRKGNELCCWRLTL